MDYIGSKKSLNDWIFKNIKSSIGEIKGLKFLDGCAGSGATSIYACKENLIVYSNDLQEYTYHIIKGSTISNEKLKESIQHINLMNNLNGSEGFFYQSYSEYSGRLYLTNDNAKKIDACREYIENISDNEIKSYLLYCLLESMSRVLNTTGVQAAFLKKYKPRSLQKLELRIENTYPYNNVNVFNEDIINLVPKIETDILYLDPPYNERQYGSNYHLYETLVKYDNPDIKGITGLRNWKQESNSNFCSKKTCLNFLKNIILLTSAKKVFISYNSDGLLSKDDIINELSPSVNKSIILHQIEYKRYKADNKRQNNTNILYEYLFDITK